MSADFELWEAGLFRCADCEGIFEMEEGAHVIPSYCCACDQEIREEARKRKARLDRFGNLEPTHAMQERVFEGIRALYEAFIRSIFLKSDGYVYLLGGGGYYKIGRSVNVSKRVKQLEIQLPWPVELIHTIPCEHHRNSEAHLHRLFSEKRANGEWFALSDEDVEFVKSIKLMSGKRIER